MIGYFPTIAGFFIEQKAIGRHRLDQSVKETEWPCSRKQLVFLFDLAYNIHVGALGLVYE